MAEAVSKEIQLPPMSTEDTVHDLMARKRDAAKNRLRFHLTETDCVLICTHGNDKYYQHGEVIAQAGQPITTVYRIKSGRICLVKDGKRLYNLTQGFFIGEGLFIHNEGEYQDYFGAALLANGPVIVTEVNVPFVRQLLEADKVLSFKMYRHIAGKLSALLLSVLGSVTVEEYVPSPTSDSSPISERTASTGSLPNLGTASTGSLPSVGTASTGSLPSVRTASTGSLPSVDSVSSGMEAHEVPQSMIMTEEMSIEAADRVTKKKPKKLHRVTDKLKQKQKTPFKVYELESGHLPVTCQLTSHKLIVLHGAVGIRTKRKIKYNKILDINKTSATTATIIYGVQARTFSFKQAEELDEFCGIVNSLIPVANKQVFSTQIAPNITSPPPMGHPPATSPPPCPPEVQAERDKAVIHQLATRQDLKKGELAVVEGDLYQRIYTVVNGELHMKKKGHHLITLREGEVFGVLSLFHLRPSMLDIEVASETATLLVIPGYKIADLVNTNFPLAVRMHKNAAQLIYSQVGQLLKSQEPPVEPFSDTNVLA